MPWTLPHSDEERLALAKGYPFDAPGFSYLFAEGGYRPLTPGESSGGLFDGRVPVIAHGSNRAPAQLARKYGRGAEIPVTRAWLADYDVVYSAHVTQYGAIAANLQHAPGARVQVFVTWLDDAQLDRMHETELGGENYHYGAMEAVRLDLEIGPAAWLDTAFVYLSARGCLARDGAPLGLAAVPAERRPHGELHQEEALALVRERHRPCRPLDQMILENICDPEGRRALVREMMAQALPAAAPHFKAIAP